MRASFCLKFFSVDGIRTLMERERLAGVYVGDMRVLARCEDRELPSGALVEQWLCRCSCGALQKRTRSNIVRAYRHKQNMACYVCRKETVDGLRAYRWQTRREYKQQLFLQWWEEKGTLYVEHLEDDPAPTQMEAQTLCSADAEEWRQNQTQQRMADLYPIQLPKDHVLQCCHCKKFFDLLFGCVECLEGVCIGCARKERHKHPEHYHHMTLRAIGDVFSLSHARTRQIEMHALRGVRKELAALEELPPVSLDLVTRETYLPAKRVYVHFPDPPPPAPPKQEPPPVHQETEEERTLRMLEAVLEKLKEQDLRQKRKQESFARAMRAVKFGG